MSDDPKARLREYLENCKIPRSREDWVGFYKELDARRLRSFFRDWIDRNRKRFEWLPKGNLDNKVNDSLILAVGLLHHARESRDALREGNARFDRWIKEWELQESKKKRDRKPKAPYQAKNWLEPMPVYSETQPFGYVQATSQRRKKIESFLHGIKAKPERPSPKKQRGRPANLYGFETNRRVLDEWLGVWCDQASQAKYDLIVKEVRVLAEKVANSKSPVDCDRLGRLRQVLRKHAKPVAKQIDADSDFDFLSSPAACAVEVKRLRATDPAPRSSGERIFDDFCKFAAGLPSELPV
jgi:hypothetical protein